jgi:hypothetical protein
VIFSLCSSTATILAERIAIRYSARTGFLIDFHTALFVLTAAIPACACGAWLNYRRRLSFQSTSLLILTALMISITAAVGCFDRSGSWNPYHPQLQWQIFTASAVITLGLVMLAAIALTLAVRLSLTPVIFSCLALLIIGLMSDYFFGQYASRSIIARLLYIITPNWQNFWTADALADNGHIPGSYIIRATLYSLLYTSGIICLGTTAFKHSEVS